MSYTLSYTLPPPLDGWWTCHKCNREVNSALNGTTCPNCSHTKCDSCKNTTPPAGPAPIRDDGVNYDANAYYYAGTTPVEGYSRETHYFSSYLERGRKHKHKRQNEGTYEGHKSTEHKPTHHRGLHNETYYTDSDDFRQYTRFPTGDMYYCCHCPGGTVYESGTCTCGHSKCDDCTRAN